ncbi:MAG: bifunctional glycosyltransferase/class I SAM-dependent methyltransferase [Actinomycetota bacterium]|nr:bifunctional glycosyltransferase/class I SAM-dependent methyltransferase [Actinomycetota bacterium]
MQVPSTKIGILVVAYNAARTLAGVLDRIPAGFRERVSEIFVCDDASKDSTYLVGLGYKELSPELPLTVIRHARNLGYGGNQKAGYRLAIEHGLDIIVLLHGDGQYAPELLPDIVAPLERGECDAAFGSRMMQPGEALKGGMPRYKYVGNRVLSRFQNAMLGMSLSEFHSGYRAYSVAALETIAFEDNTDDFHFDTQIIIQLHRAGKRIAEVPIPTYYGDEICHVNGLKYAKDVVLEVMRYRAETRGLGSGVVGTAGDEYQFKASAHSSHGRIIQRLAQEPASRVLDVGCAGGQVSRRLRELGHHVVGIDAVEQPGVAEHVDRFVRADLDAGVPDTAGTGFDVIVCGDVIEHTRAPEALLAQLRERLGRGGLLLASVPNFAHWYPRARVAVGAFDYDQRGILDKTHLRFFTRKSFQRLAERSGFEVRRVEPVGIPFEALGAGQGRLRPALRALERAVLGLYPKLFAYQFLFELVPAADDTALVGGQGAHAGQKGGGRDHQTTPEAHRLVAHLHL